MLQWKRGGSKRWGGNAGGIEEIKSNVERGKRERNIISTC